MVKTEITFILNQFLTLQICKVLRLNIFRQGPLFLLFKEWPMTIETKRCPLPNGEISPMCASPLNGMPKTLWLPSISIFLFYDSLLPWAWSHEGNEFIYRRKTVLHPSNTEKEILLLYCPTLLNYYYFVWGLCNCLFNCVHLHKKLSEMYLWLLTKFL